MHTIPIDPDFSSWRLAAREALRAGTPPEEILWDDGSGSGWLLSGASGKRDGEGNDLGEETGGRTEGLPKVPPAFLSLARLVACHRDGERWGLLYLAAWRLVREGERHLLELAADPLVRRLELLAKEVRRDRHKMTAFVRFRKVGERRESGREQFVAWFEPEHRIVELTAPFFAKRFAGMDWSILTPERCVHWGGDRLRFTEGVPRSSAPGEDELEDYWRSYYASIFNPARLKLGAMRSEMPVRYWRNLPEAPLIRELAASSAYRTSRMIDRGVNEDRGHVSARIPSGVPEAEAGPVDSPADVVEANPEATLEELGEAAACCRACPLHERATRTVFGSSPADASIMIVGEQPGDQEDLVGQPFVGPAGQLLDEALARAGIDRDRCYLTNTVKHFKWKPGTGAGSRGRLRLHQGPSASEVQVCRPWLLAEVLRVRPRVLVCLGATAARALIRVDFRISSERGIVTDPSPLAPCVVATPHPSSLLRMRETAQREAALETLVEDLRIAAVAAAGPRTPDSR